MAADNSPTKSSSTDAFQGNSHSSRILAETASDAIITINEDSTIVYVNRAATKVFGYSQEELMGAKLTILMPEYLRHLHKAGLKQYIETGKKHIAWEAVELPGLHKNGEEISLEVSFGEFSSDGHRFFTGIARDVTKRKNDERRLTLQHSIAEILATADSLTAAAPKLLQSICFNLGYQFAALWLSEPDQKHLQLISHWRDHTSPGTAQFEATSLNSHFEFGKGFPGMVWQAGKPVWIENFGSENFSRSSIAATGDIRSAFGFPVKIRKDVLGVVELFSVQTKEADPLTLDNLMATGSQLGQFIERKKKEAELVNALQYAEEARREAEKLSEHVSALQRITDVALAHFSVEEVLAESLSRIRQVLNVDTVAILLLEREGDEMVAWAAQGLEEEVEMGVRIPVGVGFAGRVVAEKRPIIIDDTSTADIFNPLLRQKGIKSLLGVPLLVEGRTTGVIHVGRFEGFHFTDDHVRLLELAASRIALAIENARLYQEERAARAEAEAANRAKDEFLTILSHELRTPLTPIIGWVHMMQNGILKESDFGRVLSVINRNAYSLKRLINDLLDMSAILTGKMKIEETSVSIGNVLEESVETMRPYARDSKVSLRLKAPANDSEVTVKGDRTRLNQAFCNILHNAIKFSPAGGSVQASWETTPQNVVIRVKDQGEGIPDQFLPHVFERFRQADASRTRNFGGLGLGLSLVKSFVEAHHGTIEARSEGLGKGSVFIVTLPVENAVPNTKVAISPHPTDTAETKKRVLIVDDQPDTLEMLSATLTAQGFEVIGCDSAIKALDVARRENFDILISDIGMPAMDGLQLVRDLRQTEGSRHTPAIALTGYASGKDIDAAIAAGFNMHLAKPVDPADLGAAVRRLLSS